MFPLIVPWLLAIIVALICYTLLKKRWVLSVILLIIAISINWYYKCFALPLWHQTARGDNNISVVCYNIDGMSGDIKIKVSQIAKQLYDKNPDVVFLTEFCEQDVPAVDTLLRRYYPYSTNDLHNEGSYFYSKFPLSPACRLQNKQKGKIGIFICETYKGCDTITLIGCHLASNNYDAQQKRMYLESLCDRNGLFTYFKNVGRAGEQRTQEARAVAQIMEKSVHQTILLGDLNDVSGSQALNILENTGLKDAWWEGGVGYGATIHKPLPYRIDHIMHTKGLILQNIKVLCSNGVSDHDALYAEFKY